MFVMGKRDIAKYIVLRPDRNSGINWGRAATGPLQQSETGENRHERANLF